MKKKFGLIGEKDISGIESTFPRNLFLKTLKKDYDVGCFSWKDVKGKNISKIYSGGKNLEEGNLDNFDIFYLNSLGGIKGKESKLIDFIDNLEGLDALVINDPKTMKNNFDKEYLLMLKNKDINVIPTFDITDCNYEEINEFKYLNYSEFLIKPKIFGERMNGIFKLHENLFTPSSLQDYKKLYGKNLLIQPFIEDIIKYGERSLIFIGDTFSHAVYRHRSAWNKNNFGGGPKSSIVKPHNLELKVAEDVLSVWPSKYHITRFDFITEKGKPLISEVEMINPSLWISPDNAESSLNFVSIFKKYLNELTS